MHLNVPKYTRILRLFINGQLTLLGKNDELHRYDYDV